MKAGATNARLYYFPLSLHHEVDFMLDEKISAAKYLRYFSPKVHIPKEKERKKKLKM